MTSRKEYLRAVQVVFEPILRWFFVFALVFFLPASIFTPIRFFAIWSYYEQGIAATCIYVLAAPFVLFLCLGRGKSSRQPGERLPGNRFVSVALVLAFLLNIGSALWTVAQTARIFSLRQAGIVESGVVFRAFYGIEYPIVLSGILWFAALLVLHHTGGPLRFPAYCNTYCTALSYMALFVVGAMSFEEPTQPTLRVLSFFSPVLQVLGFCVISAVLFGFFVWWDRKRAQ